MLWDASVVKGYGIEAHGGRLGSVSDFLFEDAKWMIRWLVVDTGHWLSDRKVLLPPSALGHPDPQSRRFPVKLTTIDTDRPDGAVLRRPGHHGCRTWNLPEGICRGYLHLSTDCLADRTDCGVCQGVQQSDTRSRPAGSVHPRCHPDQQASRLRGLTPPDTGGCHVADCVREN
jgi:hypothetical protein